MKVHLPPFSCGIALVLLLVTSCGEKPQSVLRETSPALAPYPRSRDVKLTKLNESLQLEYWVDEEFPASAAVSWVTKNLTDNGWKQLSGSYFNPQLEGVKISDWVKVIDARGAEENVVYQKSFDWKDAQNNILVYGFEYRYPRRSEPQLQSVHVRAILIPADVAKAQVEAGQKALKGLGGK